MAGSHDEAAGLLDSLLARAAGTDTTPRPWCRKWWRPAEMHRRLHRTPRKCTAHANRCTGSSSRTGTAPANRGRSLGSHVRGVGSRRPRCGGACPVREPLWGRDETFRTTEPVVASLVGHSVEEAVPWIAEPLRHACTSAMPRRVTPSTRPVMGSCRGGDSREERYPSRSGSRKACGRSEWRKMHQLSRGTRAWAGCAASRTSSGPVLDGQEAGSDRP